MTTPTKIKIGADELILWLRKNKENLNTPNEGAQGLGRQIHDLIVNTSIKGEKTEDNKPSLWENPVGDENGFGLPKTSAQYEIRSSKLGELFEKLNEWR